MAATILKETNQMKNTIQTESTEANRQPYTVMLADDEPQNLKELFDILRQEHYELVLAPNGQEAVELSKKYLPHAIIMDWDMPVMTGLEAVKAIRATAATQHIPIIMATGKMTTTHHLRLALEAGANDYIRKPFDNIEIIARVRAMVQLQQKHQTMLALQKEMDRRELAQANHQLEINTQAMITMKIRMLDNANNLNQLIENLTALIPLLSDEMKFLITDIISSSKTRSLVVNWEEFDRLFSQVHQSFYTSLQERFPDITPTERKLCGLVKLNMMTKEIAAILNLSPDAIKKTKYRLKVKLGLPAEESLSRYILELN